MGLKRRSKVSAEFSMSSLTDIIFLLLIFFMLTSSLVQIRLDLPEAEAKTIAPSDIIVEISPKGQYKLKGEVTQLRYLQNGIQELIQQSDNPDKATVTIAAEKGVEWKKVSEVMKIANNLKCRAIIATQPLKG
jgi:biopolymer transport protein ExbD